MGLEAVTVDIQESMIDGLHAIAEREGVSASKVLADAIALYLAIEPNMSKEDGSRLVIEQPKGVDDGYKLLLKNA